MFICKACYEKTSAKDTFWWDIAPKSNGTCEECNYRAVCADIHHSKVPPIKPLINKSEKK